MFFPTTISSFTTTKTTRTFTTQKTPHHIPPPISSTSSDTTNNNIIKEDSIPPHTIQPLKPQTYAGSIERALLEKFKDQNIDRVLESWRLLDSGYEHYQYVGDVQPQPPDVKDTSQCYQHAPSYVRDLRPISFWNKNDFSWCQKLETFYPQIKEEFVRVAQQSSSSSVLQQKGNNVWKGALTTDAESYGTGWKTLPLMNRAKWDHANVQLFPVTSRCIVESGIPCVEAFFASMTSGSDIKLHSDFTNFVLTSHLALDVPENGHNKCRLTVGDETREWLEGQMMLFDTSILHSAVNEADRTRFILMFRVWHPDLEEVEREALQFIYDCLEVEELMEVDDLGKRFMAEQRVEMLKEFPGHVDKKKEEEGFQIEEQGKRKGGKRNKGKVSGGGGGGFGGSDKGGNKKRKRS